MPIILTGDGTCFRSSAAAMASSRRRRLGRAVRYDGYDRSLKLALPQFAVLVPTCRFSGTGNLLLSGSFGTPRESARDRGSCRMASTAVRGYGRVQDGLATRPRVFVGALNAVMTDGARCR